MPTPILQIKALKKYFPIEKGFIKHIVGNVRAVDGINFEINDMETVGLVGESGCGKSTTGNCIVRLLDPTEGEILYRYGTDQYIDLATIPLKQLKPYRSQIQMIFQDPYSSLNPRMTVHDIIAEPIRIFSTHNKGEVDDKVTQLMRRVGLRPEYMIRYPHAFSGGQRQRVGIARALALNPQLVICDEAISSLDVSVQAQILGLLEDLRDEFNMSYLFIAHDLSAVKHISDRIVVMYVGKVFEVAETTELFNHPMHPYTEALLASVPKLHVDRSIRKETITGEVPDPSNPPSGCYFHPRCNYATAECAESDQRLYCVNPGDAIPHFTSCIHYERLSLRGV
jgi:peptide/nickel transport system ATP-binding protein